MKTERDEKRAVYTVQRWLCALSNAGMPLPGLIPDGIYGKETKDCVSAFQGIEGLKQTGEVDADTWAALRNAADKALRACARSEGIYPFEYNKRGGEVSPKDRSDLLTIVQVILRTLETQFDGLIPQEITSVCDETTMKNVGYLQKLWGLNESGRIDLPTWNMLAKAYNLYMNRE